MANSAWPTAMANSTRMLERLTFGILLRRLSGIFGFVFKLISDLRLLTSGLCALLFAVSGVAEAQQFVKLPRIGFLSGNSFSDNKVRIEAFRQGLRELGYVEGKNILIEWRSAEGKFDRLPALATELVSLKVDVIVSYGPTPTRVAKKATATVPIVMGFDGDPVGSGMVASLAWPGGDINA